MSDVFSEEEIKEMFPMISKREKQVIYLILEGKLNKQIADKLGFVTKTAEAHRKNIFKKINCKKTYDLFKLCITTLKSRLEKIDNIKIEIEKRIKGILVDCSMNQNSANKLYDIIVLLNQEIK
jgi:DNA-binding CsgD family transcriptional regulator